MERPNVLLETCPTCHGAGRVEHLVWEFGRKCGHAVERIVLCHTCDGEGAVAVLCGYCFEPLDALGDCESCRQAAEDEGAAYVRPDPFVQGSTEAAVRAVVERPGAERFDCVLCGQSYFDARVVFAVVTPEKRVSRNICEACVGTLSTAHGRDGMHAAYDAAE